MIMTHSYQRWDISTKKVSPFEKIQKSTFSSQPHSEQWLELMRVGRNSVLSVESPSRGLLVG